MPGETKLELPVESVPSKRERKGTGLFATRRRVPIDYDFRLFQLVLRYLYTNSICFLTSSSTCVDPNVPATKDVEGVYKIAKALEIEPLRDKAMHFLIASCTVNNISGRAFSIFAKEHSEVSEVYDAYLLKHYAEVIESDEFKEIYDSEGDAEESRWIKSKILRLMRQASKLK